MNRKPKLYVLFGALISSAPVAGVLWIFLLRELPKSESFQTKPMAAGCSLRLLAAVGFAGPG